MVVQGLRPSLHQRAGFGSLLNDYLAIMKSQVMWRVLFARRAANRVAHSFAKLASLYETPLEWHEKRGEWGHNRRLLTLLVGLSQGKGGGTRDPSVASSRRASTERERERERKREIERFEIVEQSIEKVI
ncbi:hypothetical protein Syun_012990 [Stephania yunnanensis]|uniref:Uncharacterized protein n=1 Tax=Stephania yunnanensis TaxID=152371 RepID=A0AAP0PJF4_9MAGN